MLATFNVAINPLCLDTVVPSRIPAGAFYWPDIRERGTYILAGTIENQKPAWCWLSGRRRLRMSIP